MKVEQEQLMAIAHSARQAMAADYCFLLVVHQKGSEKQSMIGVSNSQAHSELMMKADVINDVAIAANAMLQAVTDDARLVYLYKNGDIESVEGVKNLFEETR